MRFLFQGKLSLLKILASISGSSQSKTAQVFTVSKRLEALLKSFS